MDSEKELRILEEIESSIEPEFGLFLDAQAYNKDFIHITNKDDPTTGRSRLSLVEWDEMVEYVVLERYDYIQYLMPIIPNVSKDGETYFDYKELKKYGAERERNKFLVLT